MAYYLTKLTISCIISVLGILLTTLLVCIPYREFGANFAIVFMKFSAVMIFYNITTFVLVFIIPNVLIVFSLRFVLWIFGIIIGEISPVFRVFSYYDSSFLDYQKFMKFMDYTYNSFEDFAYNISTQDMLIIIGQDYLYNVFLVILSVLLIYLFRKKWLVNGVK